MKKEMHSTLLLDLKDTDHALWWKTVNINITLVCLKTPQGTFNTRLEISISLPSLLESFKHDSPLITPSISAGSGLEWLEVCSIAPATTSTVMTTGGHEKLDFQVALQKLDLSKHLRAHDCWFLLFLYPDVAAGHL